MHTWKIRDSSLWLLLFLRQMHSLRRRYSKKTAKGQLEVNWSPFPCRLCCCQEDMISKSRSLFRWDFVADFWWWHTSLSWLNISSIYRLNIDCKICIPLRRQMLGVCWSREQLIRHSLEMKTERWRNEEVQWSMPSSYSIFYSRGDSLIFLHLLLPSSFELVHLSIQWLIDWHSKINY